MSVFKPPEVVGEGGGGGGGLGVGYLNDDHA